MKKVVSGLLVLMMMFALAACGGSKGGDGGADPIVGEWKFSSMSAMGQEITMDQLEALGVDSDMIKITLTEDGKFTMAVIDPSNPTDTQTMEGTWANKDGAYTITTEGAEQTISLSEDGKTLSVEESGASIIFAK